MGTGMSLRPSAAIALLALAGASANAEVTVDPRVGLTETLTDNVRLDDANKKTELVTQVSPGIRVDIKGAKRHFIHLVATCQQLELVARKRKA